MTDIDKPRPSRTAKVARQWVDTISKNYLIELVVIDHRDEGADAYVRMVDNHTQEEATVPLPTRFVVAAD